MATQHFDAVIVGSGFGGSVAAYRLAEAGLRVCVLERGRAYPPGSFPRTPHGMKANFWDPSAGLYGLYNVWSFRHIDALVSSGLGGGSLIYANVLLRKDERWFVRGDAAGSDDEYWPVTRADLDPHYDRVERMLAAQRYPFEAAPYSDTPKTRAMRLAGDRLGLEWMLPPLAVTFANDGEAPVPGEPIRERHPNLHGRTRYTCRLCGECDIGCNYGSKNTLDYTYLSAAKRLGAELRTLCEARHVAPREQGGYTIGYRRHRPDAPRGPDAPYAELTTDILVLAAGTLGSTYLLLNNRAFLPGLSPMLGRRFCGNGDLLTFAVRCTEERDGRPAPRVLNGAYGPVITSALRMPDALDGGTGRGFYIEDAGYPAFVDWMLETTQAPGALRRGLRFAVGRVLSALGIRKDTDIGAELAEMLGPCELSATSLPLLGMGRDVPDGELTLEEAWLESEWRIDAALPYFARLRETMKRIADAWGGGFKDNLIWHLNRRVITVHPLGGAPMGRSEREGVVDAYGEVFNHPGLFVADGAVMPGPVGANPALTIAALADRFAGRMVERHTRLRRTRRTPKVPAGGVDGDTGGPA